ncbi:MAG TPA: hypothetical protein VFP17_10045 [Solirubrobacterales bacterium]|nr:hypothetical protein [Solirubrobacterales bacterium]
MKHVKMLGLLVMAAASLMAFASSASAAPVLTSPSGTEYTGEIHATLEKGTSAVLKAGIEDTCTESTAKGTVSVNNTAEASGTLSALTFGSVATPCSQDTTTITPGKLTIKDTTNEVLTTGSRVEVKVTGLGITCFYGAETGSVKIGTLTGGTPAKLSVSTTALQRETGSNTTFCALNGTWTGTYIVTTPSTLLTT